MDYRLEFAPFWCGISTIGCAQFFKRKPILGPPYMKPVGDGFYRKWDNECCKCCGYRKDTFLCKLLPDRLTLLSQRLGFELQPGMLVEFSKGRIEVFNQTFPYPGKGLYDFNDLLVVGLVYKEQKIKCSYLEISGDVNVLVHKMNFEEDISFSNAVDLDEFFTSWSFSF